MEIIDELEVSRRGLYGGVVGYLDFAGDADAAIAIRTALLRDGVAYVQAGGGIVADSDPPTEDQESQNKAAAVVRADLRGAELSSRSSRLDEQPRRLRWPCCSPAGALALVAGAQPWWRATSDGCRSAFTGNEATGGLSQALAVVVLAGTLLMLVLRVRGRRIVGGLLVACRARAGRCSGCCGSGPSADAVRTQVREVSLADQFALTGDGLAVGVRRAPGALVLAGARAAVMSTAARWPARRPVRAAIEHRQDVGPDGSGRRLAGPGRRSGPDHRSAGRRPADRRPRCAQTPMCTKDADQTQWSAADHRTVIPRRK